MGNTLRTLRIDGAVYRYRVQGRQSRIIAGVPRLATVFTAFMNGKHAPMRFVFPESPEHGPTLPERTGVIAEYRDPKWMINLHRPAVAEALIKIALDAGWQPDTAARREFVIEDAYELLRDRCDRLEGLSESEEFT